MIAEKAQTEVRVRILLGDPDSPYLAERGSAEGIDDAMPADCFADSGTTAAVVHKMERRWVRMPL